MKPLACLCVSAGLLLGSLSKPLQAQTHIIQPSVAAVGIGYESIAYPHQVRFLELEFDGQRLRMAFMDVPPVGTARGTILLFHGKNFASDYWAPVLGGLASSGWRVIAADQIGFGKSSKPEITYSFDLLSTFTIKLLDALALDRVHVVGNSMGGMLAIRFASMNPDRVQRLVLENPIGLEDYGAIPVQSTASLVRQEMAQTTESYRRFLKTYFPKWRGEYERFVSVFAGIQASGDYPRFAHVSALTYQMIHRQPVLADLASLTNPVLLLIGQKDRTVFGRRFAPPEIIEAMGNFPELGKRTAARSSNVTLVALDELGHVPHLEAPDLFVEHVTQFFDGKTR